MQWIQRSVGLAIVATAWSLDAAIAFAPSNIPRLHEAGLNAGVVWFAMALALLVTTIGVVLPGVRAGSTAIAPALKDGAPASGRGRREWAADLRSAVAALREG